jgi:hypothetical protein
MNDDLRGWVLSQEVELLEYLGTSGASDAPGQCNVWGRTHDGVSQPRVCRGRASGVGDCVEFVTILDAAGIPAYGAKAVSGADRTKQPQGEM